jgi:hypothetical protein
MLYRNVAGVSSVTPMGGTLRLTYEVENLGLMHSHEHHIDVFCSQFPTTVN